MKYPQAGDLQRETVSQLTGNPAPRGNASGRFEVRSSDGGLEQVFARQEDADLYADELRRIGAAGVRVETRGRPLGPRASASPAQNPESLTRDQAALAFMHVIREPGLESMAIAEDIILQYRLPLAELSEAGRTNDSTRGAFVVSPAEVDVPVDSIEWEVEKLTLPQYYGSGGTRSPKPHWGIGFKFTWRGRDEWLLVPSTTRYLLTRDAAERAAATDAWALAKQMKVAQRDEEATRGVYGADDNFRHVLTELRRVLQRTYQDKTAPEVYQMRASPKGELPKKQRTYLEARDDIWSELRRHDWTMSPVDLRLPHATSPNGVLRLWFKPQAVHYTLINKGRDVLGGLRSEGRHNASDAHSISYDLDIRKLSPSEFLDFIRQRYRGFS